MSDEDALVKPPPSDGRRPEQHDLKSWLRGAHDLRRLAHQPPGDESEERGKGEEPTYHRAAYKKGEHESAKGVVGSFTADQCGRSGEQHDDRALDQQRKGHGQSPRGEVESWVREAADSGLDGGTL